MLKASGSIPSPLRERGVFPLDETASGVGNRAGLTLVELIVAFTIMLILSTMALPLAHVKVAREKERRLRDALTEMRKAVDRYKDAADQGMLGELDPENHGYPESLEILVEGVETSGGMGSMGMGMGMGANGMGGGFGQPMGGANQRSGFGQQSGFGSSNRGSRGSSFGGGGSSGFGGQTGFGGNRSNRNSQGSGFGNQRSGFGASRQSGFGSQQDAFGSDEDGSGNMRFLRKIPVDPISGRAEWGMRSVSDDPGSMSWNGRNVFDVFSLSMDTALDGTRYSDW